MKPSEKLAESLKHLKKLQTEGGYAVQSKDLSRTHRERLITHGFLGEVVKGWYIPIKPDERRGDSTAWYTSFWNFCASYLNTRFDDKWCLSPEQSLLIHAENWTVPKQLLVRSPKGSNKNMELPHQTSLFQVRYKMPAVQDIEVKQGLHIYSVVSGLVYCSPKFFTHYPTDARAILSMVTNASQLLHYLLAEGHASIAGRLCGAFQNMGKHKIGEEIAKTMRAAGYEIREHDPFSTETPMAFVSTNKPAYRARLQMMWHAMSGPVRKNFPTPKQHSVDVKAYLKKIEEAYTNDAYHSLSIEGYQVSHELIEKVRRGRWNPETMESDRTQRNALAARGYWQAFKSVEKSIELVLRDCNPGKVVEENHSDWYRAMFQPSVAAGLLKPTDLAGYRNNPVFIRQSKHVPSRAQIVSELMEEFFQLLENEENAAVRVVLGHFFFVYIHPYPDGNGRVGRFLMNVMLAAGNYPWTIIPVDKRNEYMDALEQASVNQDIVPFCNVIASCIR
jgi:hypothetical protein